MTEGLVIVGAGQAAAQLVISLRQGGYDLPICMLGAEQHPPYQRPPLSKKFLAGELTIDRLYIRPPEFYTQSGVQLLLGREAIAIDRQQRRVALRDGSFVGYRTLVLATGSRPRRLSLPGADLPGVFYLRTIDDVAAIRAAMQSGRRLAIVGGGYIGLELAAVAARSGLAVQVLEQAGRLLMRGVGPELADAVARLHQAHDVAIDTGVALRALRASADGLQLLTDRSVLIADLVVIGVGAVANVDLAGAAGLAVEEGIVVDAACRTADADILAIGDCTLHPNPAIGRPVRLESVHNALEQARIAAATILGQKLPVVQTPWFWSDQYDSKLQIAGLIEGGTTKVVRGDPLRAAGFAVFHLRGGVLVAAETLDRPAEFMMARQAIARGARIEPRRLADETVEVRDLPG